MASSLQLKLHDPKPGLTTPSNCNAGLSQERHLHQPVWALLAECQEDHLSHGPSLHPTERGNYIKPFPFSPRKAKMILPQTILSCLLSLAPLPHPSSYITLLFCPAPPTVLLAARWHAVGFTRRLIRPMRWSNLLGWILCFNTSDLLEALEAFGIAYSTGLPKPGSEPFPGHRADAETSICVGLRTQSAFLLLIVLRESP